MSFDQPARVFEPDARVLPTSEGGRVAWLDVARGIGIFLVVLGHAVGGLIGSGLATTSGVFGAVFVLVYSFHMPLFFSLTAVLMPERLLRGRRRILRSALMRIVYPYFIWGIIQLIFITAMGRLVNTPYKLEWMLIIQIIWIPPSQFWFLYCLLVFQVAATLFDRFSNVGTMLVFAIVLRILPEAFELPKIIDASLRFWIYYCLAIYYSKFLLARSYTGWSCPVYLSCLALAWGSTVIFSAYFGGDQSIAGIPAAILGVLLFLEIAKHVSSRFRDVFIGLGLRSMPIFVTHVLIVAGIRILLVKLFHFDEPFLILLTACAAGLYIPCLFFDWAHRWGIASFLALE